MKQCLRLLRPCVIHKYRAVKCTAFAAYLPLSRSSIRGHGTKPESPLQPSTKSTDVSDRLHELGTINLWPRIISSDRKLTIRGFIEKFGALNEPEISSRAEEVVLHGTYILQITQLLPNIHMNRQSKIDS